MAGLNLLARPLDRFASCSPKRARARAERLSKAAPDRALCAVRGGGRGGRRGSGLRCRRALSRGQGHTAPHRPRLRAGTIAPPRPGMCARNAASRSSISLACRRRRLGQTRACSSQSSWRAPQYHAAVFWARRAAEAGAPDAQAMLAYIFSSGPEDLRDPDAAFEWYRNPPNRIARRAGWLRHCVDAARRYRGQYVRCAQMNSCAPPKPDCPPRITCSA